jgi:hypothetical protein
MGIAVVISAIKVLLKAVLQNSVPLGQDPSNATNGEYPGAPAPRGAFYEPMCQLT